MEELLQLFLCTFPDNDYRGYGNNSYTERHNTTTSTIQTIEGSKKNEKSSRQTPFDVAFDIGDWAYLKQQPYQ